jgi:hypothetical protein
MREVRCLNKDCGAVNRLSRYSITRIATCGKCRQPLPEPRWIKLFHGLYRHREKILPLALFSFVGLIILQAPLPPSATVPDAPPAAPVPPPKCALSAEPREGIVFEDSKYDHVAPFTIRTASGGQLFCGA